MKRCAQRNGQVASNYYPPSRIRSLGRLNNTPPPSAHLRLILREHKIIPSTKESYRVYVGTGNKNSNCVTPFNLVNMPRLLSPFLTELLQGSIQKGLNNLGILNEWLAMGFC